MIANRSQRTFTLIQHIIILIQNNIFGFVVLYLYNEGNPQKYFEL